MIRHPKLRLGAQNSVRMWILRVTTTCMHACMHTHTHAHTHTHNHFTALWSLDFVWDNPGKMVPEGTFRHILDFLVQNEDNTGRRTNNPDGLPRCHPIQTNWCPHLYHPTIFTPDALPGTTLPIYPGLGQAPNMLACIPVSLKVRGRLYSSCVRSSMLYGSETWPVRGK